jgi:hypothetical protein
MLAAATALKRAACMHVDFSFVFFEVCQHTL